MTCKFCKSERLILKKSPDGKTGLYCANCDKWQRWVPDDEVTKVREELDRIRLSIPVSMSDIDQMHEQFHQYKIKLANMSSYLDYYKKRSEAATSKAERDTLFQKLVAIKELQARIDTYRELMELLKIDSVHLNARHEL